MKLFKTSLLSAVIACGLMGGTVQAQETGQPQQAPAAPQQQAPQIDVSDDQVSDFVDAYIAVQTLNQQYAAKLQSTEDKEKAKKLQQSAQKEMKAAITDTGLSLGEYKKIAQAANGNEQLRQRISEEISSGAEQAQQPQESGS